MSEVHRITRELTRANSNSNNPVKDKNGNKITIENLKLKRWAKHFKEAPNRPDPTEIPILNETFGEIMDIHLEPPTKDEITKAILKLKNNKAPGIDNLNGELFRTDIKTATDQLYIHMYYLQNYGNLSTSLMIGAKQ